MVLHDPLLIIGLLGLWHHITSSVAVFPGCTHVLMHLKLREDVSSFTSQSSSHMTSDSFHILSSLDSKDCTVSACITESGRLFHWSTTLLVKDNILVLMLLSLMKRLYLWPLLLESSCTGRKPAAIPLSCSPWVNLKTSIMSPRYHLMIGSAAAVFAIVLHFLA